MLNQTENKEKSKIDTHLMLTLFAIGIEISFISVWSSKNILGFLKIITFERLKHFKHSNIQNHSFEFTLRIFWRNVTSFLHLCLLNLFLQLAITRSLASFIHTREFSTIFFALL